MISFKFDGIMKTLYKIVGCLALTTVLFACNKEVEGNLPDVNVEKHWVKVIASQNAMTKTTLVEADKSTLWSAEDEDNMHLFENGVAPSPDDFVVDISSDHQSLSMLAAFSGTAPFEYTSILASNLDETAFVAELPDVQEMVEGSFDPAADILVADPQKYDEAQEEFSFQYARVVAINKMTIKGLTAGDVMKSVTISSDKPILGSYDMTTYEWTNSGNQLTLSYKGENEIGSDGIWAVYFITAPVEGAILTIDVQTDNATYEKTFTKTINFPQNAFTTFATSVAGCEVESEAGPSYTWTLASGDLGTTGSPVATVTKGNPQLTWSAVYTWGEGADMFFGWDGNYSRGVQIGKGSEANKCVSAVFSTSGYTGYIEKIKVNFSHASSGGSSASVKIGDVDFVCEGETSVPGTTSAADYIFTSDDLVKGNIVITLSNSAAKAIYLNSIEINPDNRTKQELSFPQASYSAELSDGTFSSPTLSGAKTEVTYTSEDETVATVDNTGLVTLLKIGSTKITATAAETEAYQQGSASYTLTVTAGPSSIATVIAADNNENVYTQGVVAEVNAKGVIITDGENNLSVYLNEAPTVEVGQKIKVAGIRSTYNNIPQIGSNNNKPTITAGATGQSVTRTPLTVITSENATGFTTSKYVSLTGKLTVSGSYYNIEIAGSTTKGSLYQAIEAHYPGGTLASLDGKYVIVTGYVAGSSASYLNIAAVNIELTPYLSYTEPEAANFVENSKVIIPVASNVSWTAAKGLDNENIIKSVSYDTEKVTVTFNANDGEEKTATIIITPSQESGLSPVTVTVKQKKYDSVTHSWNLVTDVASLAAGDVVVIAAYNIQYTASSVSYTDNKVMGAITNSLGSAVDVTFGEDGATIEDLPSAAQQYTLGGDSNGWTFVNGNKYLTFGDKKLTEETEESTWTISIANGISTISHADGTKTWKLQYNPNSGNGRFATYTSNQKGVRIYRYE